MEIVETGEKCIFSRLGMYTSLAPMRCIGICRVTYFGGARDYCC